MANAAKLHQLKASAQYSAEGVQRFMDSLVERLGPDKANDSLDFAKSNAWTTTGAAVKASAGRLLGVIIEPAATAAVGTGGSGYVQIYNAASMTNLTPGVGTALALSMDTIKFVTGMTRTIGFDPSYVDNTSLYSSGISVVVATTADGSTAVAALPTVTVIYA